MSTSSWTIGGASVRGSSHVRTGLPNQDALASWCDADQALPAIVAVADGHGGARHFRSEQGARFAVDTAIETLRALASAIDSLSDDARPQFAAVEIAPRIVEQWRARVMAHLAANAITDAEWRALLASDGEAAVESVRLDPLLAYGATLLAALVTNNSVVLAQLGDGDILAIAPDGSTTRPVPADERLIGNTTTSLCQVGAEADFRVVVLPASRAPLAMLMLSTDGYANSFKTDSDFLQVGRDLLGMIAAEGLDKVGKQLPGFLQHASENGSGDDISLGLLCRTSASAGAATGAVGDAMKSAADPAGAKNSTDAAPGSSTMKTGRTDVSMLRSELHAAKERTRRLTQTVVALVIAGLACAGWFYRDRLFHADGATVPTVADPPSRHPTPPAPPATTGGQGGEPQIKAGGARRGGKADDAPAVSQDPLSEPTHGGGMPSGEPPHLLQQVRAEMNDSGIATLVSVRSVSAEKRSCDLEATAIGPAGKALGASSAKIAVEPMSAAEHRLQIELGHFSRKQRALLGSVNVSLRCSEGHVETVRIPMPGAVKNV